MTPILGLAIVLMVSALVLYSIGVWSEKFAGQLKAWHLIFFWLGFAADTSGTTLMGKIAGSFTLNFHSLTGLAAIALMFAHAVWASLVLLRRDREHAAKFHKFSVTVWIIWLIPFVSGMALAMFGEALRNVDISPGIHIVIGALVFMASLASFAAAGWLAWKKQPLNSLASRIFIVTQLMLIAQILAGIELLDQGFAPLQVYAHYLGGTAPLVFFLLFYWLRTNDKLKEARLATAATGAAFLSVLLTLAIRL